MKEQWFPSCLIVMFLIRGFLCAAERTLFDENDKVIVYHEETYKDGLYNGETAHIFLLYSSWCGHCQRFAPIYKELAKAVEGWSEIALVTGVDCVQDTETCQHFKVRGYPTLKFIGPTTNTSATGVTYDGSRTVDKMKAWIIDSLSEVKNPPITWPDLKALSEEEAESYLSANSERTHLIALVADESLGREILIELHSQITIRYALATSSMAHILKAESPSIIVISKGDVSNVKEIPEDWTAGVIVEFITRKFGFNADHSDESNKGNNEDNQDFQTVNTALQYKLFEVDMQSAINNAFYTEIGLKTNFTAQELDDLKNFLLVSQRCGSWTLEYKKLLSQIQNQVSDLTSLNGTSWHKILENTADNGFPRNSSFIGCRGSRPTTRGYSCSLWVLFHSMLASCYSPTNSSYPSSVDVLHAIHGYVSSFFTCSHCRTHFLAMSERMSLLSIADNKAAVLALWQAHNQVNARLSGVAHDPYFPKVQFPPQSECDSCAAGGGGGQFDTNEVFSFLLKHYSRVLTPYGKIRISNQVKRRRGYKTQKAKSKGKTKGRNKGKNKANMKGKN